MAMTKEEKMTKEYIWRKLSEEGYPTYANIFWDLDLHLTAAPSVVGYMEPTTGTITINRNLDEDQFSVIIRHEILHNYLQHENRLLQHLAKERGMNPDELTDMDIEELRKTLYADSDFNYAGDYEISNRGYTEEDKETVRKILLYGQELKGLVTEDDHPEWVDWSIEDMYDAIKREKKQAEQEAKQDMNNKDDQEDQSGEGEGEGGQGQQSQGQGDQSPEGQSSGSQQGGSQQSGDNSDGGESDGEGSDSDDVTYVYGSFIDDETFIDADGNVVVFDEEK